MLRRILSYIPTFLLALALSLAVWISAVTANDPVEERALPRQLPLELIGLDPSMIITGQDSTAVSVRVSAPRSIWEKFNSGDVQMRAVVDLSNLGEGSHTLEIQPQINLSPIQIVSVTPRTYHITLEKLQVLELPLKVVVQGEPATGFQAGASVPADPTITVSGPRSRVEAVAGVQVVLDVTRANENISRSLVITPHDESGSVLSGLTLNPDQTLVTTPITQLGGYRNVVVKVITSGLVDQGYRLTTISVFPPTVTVFSSNPSLVDNLPGFVQTAPVDLSGAKDDIDTRLNLDLPDGVSVVDEPTVNVIVGIAAIEGSLTLYDRLIEVVNLDPKLSASISPQRVTVILSGPLPLLDRLQPSDTRITLDLGGLSPGTYQIDPKAVTALSDMKVESILPNKIEVKIAVPTPTPQPTN